MTQTKRSKKTSSKNKTTKNTKNVKAKKPAAQTNPEVRSEVILILFFVLCVLMLLSSFGICGAFGNLISGLLFGVFGYLLCELATKATFRSVVKAIKKECS